MILYLLDVVHTFTYQGNFKKHEKETKSERTCTHTHKEEKEKEKKVVLRHTHQRPATLT